MAVTIRVKRGTAAQWAARTTALFSGEFGYDTTNKILKIGDGTSLWAALGSVNSSSTTQIEEIAQDAVADALTNFVSAGNNITVEYNDEGNYIVLDTGPDVVLQSDLTTAITGANEYTDDAVSGLGNSLSGTYVLVSDVANPDGVAPLDENSLIPDQYIPSTIARDSELFSGSYNDLSDKPNIALGAVQWTANHTLLPGGENTRYLAGDIVYDNGNIYVANYENESIPTSSTLYWTSIGSGKRLNIDGRDIPNITYDQLNGKPTIPSLTGYATETYVNTAVSNLVDSAPETLNTLNELAAAINDDASYASTITTALGTKAPLDSPTFTGSIYATDSTITAAQFVKPYGTSAQFLKADGSSDSTSYATQASLDLKSDQIVTINPQSSGYTLATSDLGKLIEMSDGGTLTIVDSLFFPVGFACDVLQTGSSQVTIAGSGFTPNATPGLKLRTQWSSATLIKRAIGVWVVIGDLSA